LLSILAWLELISSPKSLDKQPFEVVCLFVRIAVFVYVAVCYLIFFGTFLYAIGFLGNIGVPKSIDKGGEAPFTEALIVNAALLGIFAIHHSVMARQWFKRGLTKLIS